MEVNEYPEKIYLVDDEFGDTKWSRHKDPFGESDGDSVEYIRADVARDKIQQLEAALREECTV